MMIIKNLQQMTRQELDEQKRLIWQAYASKLTYDNFIHIFEKYLWEHNICPTEVTKVTYVGMLGTFYATQRYRDYI